MLNSTFQFNSIQFNSIQFNSSTLQTLQFTAINKFENVTTVTFEGLPNTGIIASNGCNYTDPFKSRLEFIVSQQNFDFRLRYKQNNGQVIQTYWSQHKHFKMLFKQ